MNKRLRINLIRSGLFLIILLVISSTVNAMVIECGASSTKVIATDGTTYTMPSGLGNLSLLNLDSNNRLNEEAIDIESIQSFLIAGSKVIQIAKSIQDETGNTYITGGFTGTIEFGNTTLTSSNGYDMFVAKISSSGEYLWARSASGSNSINHELSIDGGTSLTLDKEGNVYVAGGFVKRIDFTNQEGDTLTSLTDGRSDSLVNFELFVAKYSTEGTFNWAIGGNSGSVGNDGTLNGNRNFINDIILDENGYPYIAGAYSGSTFMGLDVNVVGGDDFFVASFNKDGSAPYWVSTMGSPDDDYAATISVDTLGYLNILGTYGQGQLYDPNGELTWENDTGLHDSYVISYDINGEWYFINIIGGGDQAIGNDIATVNNGDHFTVGEFTESILFLGETSQEDIELESSGALKLGFIASFDLQGYVKWAHTIGGGGTISVNSITTDLDGNAYVLGRFSETVLFGEETGSPVSITTQTENDLYIAKYTVQGEFEWVKHIENTGSMSRNLLTNANVFSLTTQPLDLAYFPNNGGQLMLAADFNGTLTLDHTSHNATENTRSSYVAVYEIAENTAVSINEDPIEIATSIALHQNYPNPFNPSTNIGFTLSKTETVSIDIFNVTGQKVKSIVNGHFSKGNHIVKFDASALPSGNYFYTITTESFSETKKMVLIK